MKIFTAAIACLALSTNLAWSEEPKIGNQSEIIASVPRVITYQGFLNDNSGNPVANGFYSLTFRLYDAPSDGNLLWTDSPGSVQTTDGRFSCELGPISLPFDNPYYISIQIEADPEMSPRQLLSSAPYSIRSDTADVAIHAINGTNWDLINDVLYTKGHWGISRGNADNALFGVNRESHVNLGVACTTGTELDAWSYCTVGGGWANTSSGLYSNVGGGYNNRALGNGSSVVGGSLNTASGSHSSVVNGYRNVASHEYSHVNTGYFNTASEYLATIGGGRNNVASSYAANIGNGDDNTASASYTFIGNGYVNTASGSNSFIGNGTENVAQAAMSTILNGYADTLGPSAQYSMAIGYSVYTNDNFRACFFNAGTGGSVNINRDERDATLNSYPIQVGNSSSNGNGAYLTNGGVWTNGSSRTFKENFLPFDGEQLLSKIANLSVTTWNYKESSEKHVGPVAEEFVGAFDTGVIREHDGIRDDQYLSPGDVAGVALAGVQELLKKIEALEKKVAELEANQR